MKQLAVTDQELRFAFDATDEPVCRVEPGERVVVETEDAYSGQIREAGDHRDKTAQPRSNPLSGPIHVEGARPGDALAVHIEDIEARIGQAATYTPGWWWFLGPMHSRASVEGLLDAGVDDDPRIMPIEDGRVRFDDETSLPFEPVLGEIGTAPGAGSVPNGGSGPHGGNMDLTAIAPGSTVYLPVRTEGALLYLGDAHAVQGEGEITGEGGEMPATVTLRTEVIDGASPGWPRIETDDAIYAVASTTQFSEFTDALRLAFVKLGEWLGEYGYEPWDAWQLGGLYGTVLVGNLGCVAAGFPKAAL